MSKNTHRQRLVDAYIFFMNSSCPNETRPNSATPYVGGVSVADRGGDGAPTPSSEDGSVNEAVAIGAFTTISLERALDDEDDTPMPVQQIANSYEDIDQALKDIKNSPSEEPPPPIEQIASLMDDQETVKINAASNKRTAIVTSTNATPNPGNRNSMGSDSMRQELAMISSSELSSVSMNNSSPTSNNYNQLQPTVPQASTSQGISILATNNEGAHIPVPSADENGTYGSPTEMPASSSTVNSVYNPSHNQVGAEEGIMPSALVQQTPAMRSSNNDQSAESFPAFHEVQATVVDNQVYDAVFLRHELNDPPESNHNNAVENRSLRGRYQKQFIFALVLIIGALAGIVGTLVALQDRPSSPTSESPSAAPANKNNGSVNGVEGGNPASNIPSPSTTSENGPTIPPSTINDIIVATIPSLIGSSDAPTSPTISSSSSSDAPTSNPSKLPSLTQGNYLIKSNQKQEYLNSDGSNVYAGVTQQYWFFQPLSWDPMAFEIKRGGKCLDYNFNTGKAYMHTCNDGKNQHWHFIGSDWTDMQVKTAYNWKCLDRELDNSWGEIPEFLLYSCNGGRNQRFGVYSG